jgi:tetratricopeptide (TPR) repeat protein
LSGIAWVLATHPDPTERKVDEAIRLAERAAELTGHKDVPALDSLAAAHAAAGEFDQAVTIAERALALATANQAEELAAEIRERLELYRQATPYRAPVQMPGAATP